MQHIRGRRTCTKRELLSLIGKLAFACKVVPPGRLFLRRPIDLLTTVTHLHHHVTLNKAARADLAWWTHFLPTWPGSSLFLRSQWTLAPDMQLFTDASNLGYGAYWAGRWFNQTWSPEQVTFTIAWKELYVILVACSTWGHLWPRKRILFYCDNAAVVEIWGKGSCKLYSRPPFSLLHAGISVGGPGSIASPSYTPHPCTQDRPLTAHLQRLQLLGVAPSTRRTYQTGITASCSFVLCLTSPPPPPPLPASPLTLRYFCTYLATSVRHSTIKLYLTAIRFQHIQHEHPDPTNDTLLQYVVKGVKRSQCVTTRPRLPVTIQVLRDLKTALHEATHQTYYNKRMLWAAFVVAFYGFLRASELCAKATNSFDPATTLLGTNVVTSPTTVRLHIKASKTDPFRTGCTVTIGATATSTCPLRAVQNYTVLRRNQPSSPAFVFEDGSYLTRQRFTGSLRGLLLAAGFDCDTYASHSFRIGAATTAAAAGLPDWQIQAMGRWSSDCYRRYIATPQSTLIQASQRLAAQTDSGA